MDIKDFVSSTIEQVMQAVAATQAAAQELGGYVNPTAQTLIKEGARHMGVTAMGQAIYAIDFDIAVTVASETGNEGGAKVQVASVLSIGGKGHGSDKNETTSRVRFSVPLMLPVDPGSKEERDELKRKADAAHARQAEEFRNSRARGRII